MQLNEKHTYISTSKEGKDFLEGRNQKGLHHDDDLHTDECITYYICAP